MFIWPAYFGSIIAYRILAIFLLWRILFIFVCSFPPLFARDVKTIYTWFASCPGIGFIYELCTGWICVYISVRDVSLGVHYLYESLWFITITSVLQWDVAINANNVYLICFSSFCICCCSYCTIASIFHCICVAGLLATDWTTLLFYLCLNIYLHSDCVKIIYVLFHSNFSEGYNSTFYYSRLLFSFLTVVSMVSCYYYLSKVFLLITRRGLPVADAEF